MTKYLHATSSAVLVGLMRTNFIISDVDNLISNHGIAPLSGEISGGGQRGATINQGIAFAKHGAQIWSYDTLVGTYTQFVAKKKFNSEKEIISKIIGLIKGNMTCIKEATILLMRETHLGIRTPLSENTVNDLLSRIDEGELKVKQYYIRNYVFAAYLRAAPEALSIHHASSHADFIDDLTDYIPLDFMERNETEKQNFIDSLPDLFNQLYNTQFSDYLRIITPTEKSGNHLSKFKLDTAIIYPDRTHFIEDYLYLEKTEPFEQLDHHRLAQEILTACIKLSESVNLLKKALCGNGVVELNPYEKSLCHNTFPLIFVLENPEESALKKVKDEFRTNRDLKIGVDITTIATNIESMSKLDAILKEHGINNVDIISLESLDPKISLSKSSLSFFQTNPVNSTATPPNVDKINNHLS